MTDKKNEAMIAALLRERAGYVAHGKDERVKAVDEQLKLYGYKSETKSESKSGAESRESPPEGRTAERPRQTTARPEVKP